MGFSHVAQERVMVMNPVRQYHSGTRPCFRHPSTFPPVCFPIVTHANVHILYCIRIFMWVFLSYAYIYIHTYLCIHTHTHTHTHTNTHAHIYICIYIRIYIYIYIHIYIWEYWLLAIYILLKMLEIFPILAYAYVYISLIPGWWGNLVGPWLRWKSTGQMICMRKLTWSFTKHKST